MNSLGLCVHCAVSSKTNGNTTSQPWQHEEFTLFPDSQTWIRNTISDICKTTRMSIYTSHSSAYLCSYERPIRRFYTLDMEALSIPSRSKLYKRTVDLEPFVNFWASKEKQGAHFNSVQTTCRYSEVHHLVGAVLQQHTIQLYAGDSINTSVRS